MQIISLSASAMLAAAALVPASADAQREPQPCRATGPESFWSLANGACSRLWSRRSAN